MSPGWQSRALQIASRVENRTAFALPVFNTDKLASVSPTFSDSSLSDIFRLAIITSRFTIIAITHQIVRLFSSATSAASLYNIVNANAITGIPMVVP